jgi:uncharacterized protein YdeI (BOF family)
VPPLTASAQEPQSIQDPQSIASLQETQPTTVQGTVDRVIENTFVLRDGTGELVVDTAPPWYMTVDVEPGEVVTVTGEVETRRDGSLKMEAYTVRPEDGAVIEIRDGPGRPPWAGGPDQQ